MLSLSVSTKIYLAIDNADMRKGFDGLYALVANQLKMNPLSGSLFLFINRRRDRLKVLYWDGDGLAIWYRRLEQGTFQFSQCADKATHVEIRSDEFTMMLRGIDLRSVKRRKRYSIAG